MTSAKYPVTDSTKTSDCILWDMWKITKGCCQTSKKTQLNGEKFHAYELGDLPNEIIHLMQLLRNPREFYNRNG